MGRKKDYRDLLKTPFNSGIRGFTTVAKYFMYYAPLIDSAHSANFAIDEEKAENILDEMLKKTELRDKARFLKRIQPSSWKKDNLDGLELDFEESRLLCDKYSKESELHSLLRHVRNSLAHGYVYVWKKKKGNYVLLIDYDSGRKKPTAKIMVSMSVLEHWKEVLENLGE